MGVSVLWLAAGAARVDTEPNMEGRFEGRRHKEMVKSRSRAVAFDCALHLNPSRCDWLVTSRGVLLPCQDLDSELAPGSFLSCFSLPHMWWQYSSAAANVGFFLH